MINHQLSRYNVLSGEYYPSREFLRKEPLSYLENRSGKRLFLLETKKLVLYGYKHYRLSHDISGYANKRFGWRHQILNNQFFNRNF